MQKKEQINRIYLSEASEARLEKYDKGCFVECFRTVHEPLKKTAIVNDAASYLAKT